MNIEGYEIGPIACEAAFIADFDIDADIPLAGLATKVDTDRPSMDCRTGMRSKYVP